MTLRHLLGLSDPEAAYWRDRAADAALDAVRARTEHDACHQRTQAIVAEACRQRDNAQRDASELRADLITYLDRTAER